MSYLRWCLWIWQRLALWARVFKLEFSNPLVTRQMFQGIAAQLLKILMRMFFVLLPIIHILPAVQLSTGVDNFFIVK